MLDFPGLDRLWSSIFKLDEAKSAIERYQVGSRSSQIVVHNGTAYLAGIVSKNAECQVVAEQTHDILDQIDAHLKAVGTSKSNLLSANIWLADMGSFDEMDRVWASWVVPKNAPVRAIVEGLLADPKYKVEIMVVAAI